MPPDGRFGRALAKSTGNTALPSDTDLRRPETLVMKLEIRKVDELDLKPPPVLTGDWAWLLFHENGTLISYSDGYPSRAACYAAARQIAWPVDVFK